MQQHTGHAPQPWHEPFRVRLRVRTGHGIRMPAQRVFAGLDPVLVFPDHAVRPTGVERGLPCVAQMLQRFSGVACPHGLVGGRQSDEHGRIVQFHVRDARALAHRPPPSMGAVTVPPCRSAINDTMLVYEGK